MPASFDSLPDELIDVVFDRLAARLDEEALDRHNELIQLARVCKRWTPLVLPRAWEIVKIDSLLAPSAQIRHLLARPQLLAYVRKVYQDKDSRLESLVSLTSTEHCTHAPEIVELLRLCPSLSRIDICIVEPEQDVLSAIAESPSARHIKRLTLTAVMKTAGSIARFLHCLAKLHSLTSLDFTWASPPTAYRALEEAFAGEKLKVEFLHLQPLLGEGEEPAVMLRFLDAVLDSAALHSISLSGWKGCSDFFHAAATHHNLKALVLGIDQLDAEPAQLGTSLLALAKLSSVTDLFLHLYGGTETGLKCPIHLGALLESMPTSLQVAFLNCLVVNREEANGIPELELELDSTRVVPVHGLVFLQVAPIAEEVQEQTQSKVTFARVKVEDDFAWRRLPSGRRNAHRTVDAADQTAAPSESKAGTGETGQPGEATASPA
ncbi:hypothetical protein BMF94_4584 [Rhodotorula taiwanensis]|uniref:F-box domain-containing protein n=1 Tax=Rhodotorula taiwanensis TaxID=741276 RepID=A0A2S5B675_9BASI|nr:hypothetical protein BMF94_4584 [Rhodotorula taiwanensis]